MSANRDSRAFCWFSDTISDNFLPLSDIASLKATKVFLLSVTKKNETDRKSNVVLLPKIPLCFVKVSKEEFEQIEIFLVRDGLQI